MVLVPSAGASVPRRRVWVAAHRRVASVDDGESGEDIVRQRQAQDVMAMPERVEEQRPRGKTWAFAVDVREQLLHRIGQADLADAGLGGDQRAELGAAPRQPFDDGNSEAALAGEGV